MDTSWKWIGDFQLGQFGVFTVWERYDENFRRRYLITVGRTHPGADEGRLGPRWRVIQEFRAKFPDATFCWIDCDYERAIYSTW